VPLELLVISYIPGIPKFHYIAVCRATGHIPRAAAILTAAAAMEVTAVVVGGATDGLKGLSLALLAVYIIEGLVTAPPVLRAALGHGRHRHADSRTAATHAMHEARISPAGYRPSTETMTSPKLTYGSERDRQEAGIANLISIARGETAQPTARSMQEILSEQPVPPVFPITGP
jgi:hypothetical protein